MATPCKICGSHEELEEDGGGECLCARCREAAEIWDGLSMKTKTAQHKTAIVFILAIITGFSSTLSFFHVRQVGVGASDLPSKNLTADGRIPNNHFLTMGRESPEAADVSVGCPEANPAIRGQAINVFSPSKDPAVLSRRVLFETSATSAKSADSRRLTIIRVRRKPNPQVANNSGVISKPFFNPSAGRAIPAT